MPNRREIKRPKEESFCASSNPLELDQNPQWFTEILISSNNQFGFYLAGLKTLCEKLLAVCKTISILMLFTTLVYAMLLWNHIPASEPRTLLVGWAVCLCLSNLGRIAIDGSHAAKVFPSVALVIFFYWMPVTQISKLLKSF